MNRQGITRIAIATLTVLSALPLLGQGYVHFANAATSRVATNAIVGGPSTGFISGPPGAYYFALFMAPTTQNTSLQGSPVDPTQFGWMFTGILATNGGAAGRLSGDVTTDPAVAVPGTFVGETANFMVAGWSANFGSTWPAAQSNLNKQYGFYGLSDIAMSVVLGNGGTNSGSIPPGMVFGPVSGSVQGFTLSVGLIPEPQALALIGLGLSGLVLLRRRRQTR